MLGLLLVLGALLACGAHDNIRAISAQADDVDVRTEAPPAGAILVGPIAVTHGHGCGMYGRVGTLEGALALLKEAAAKRGADYVHVTKTTEPHHEGACLNLEYGMRGKAYKLLERAASDARQATVGTGP